jgi:hypothetical protein
MAASHPRSSAQGSHERASLPQPFKFDHDAGARNGNGRGQEET